jgi:hypothetical protein
MWKKTERAFDIMRERNRRYIEEKKKEEAENRAKGDEPSDESVESDKPDESGVSELSEEQRIAAEKLRAYREANGLDPDADIPEGPEGPQPAGGSESEDLSPEEAEHRAEEYRKKNEDSVKLEKGDLPAMIIAALLVFGPVFLVLFGILFLAWLFLH